MVLKIDNPQNKISEKHQAMFQCALKSLKQLADKSSKLADIPKVDNTFTPYGLDFGCTQKEALSKLKYFRELSSYYLTTQFNGFYKVYFVDISVEKLSFTGQFHLINGHFFLAHTSFATPLYNRQYERIIKGLIEQETIPDEVFGVHPYYLKDQRSCLLRIHNYTGSPSFTYYLECEQIKQQMTAILAANL
jgi:hypothetical protein